MALSRLHTRPSISMSMTGRDTFSVNDTKRRGVERTGSPVSMSTGTGRARPSTRARAVVAVGLAMKSVGKPDAGNPHVRFDERGRETGLCYRARPRLYRSKAR